MSKETNVQTQQKMAEAVNKGDLDVLREVFSPNVEDHDPAPDQGAGHFLGYNGVVTLLEHQGYKIEQL